MPTAAIRNYTKQGVWPCEDGDHAIEMNVNLAQGTYAQGTILGELTATPGTFAAYNNGAGDGSQTAKCILQYPTVVDASGNYWMGDTSGASEHGQAAKCAPAWRSGVFKAADLVGLDANAVTDLGRLKTGDTTTGILVVYGN
jgi:hypothetical protein